MDADCNNNVDVSIIIINYRDYEMTERCILSIINHSKSLTYDIILVDNDSNPPDAQRFREKFRDIIFIENKDNRGFAAANNQALPKARGKYILFLNNDTLFIEDTLAKVYEFCERRDSECFVGCKLLNEDYSRQESLTDFDNVRNVFGENLFLYRILPNIRSFNKYYLNRLDTRQEIEAEVIKGAFLFCPALRIKKMGGFDENFYFYGEEVDLCYRFKASGGEIFYLPTTSIIHIGRATSMKNLGFKFENQSKAKLKFYLKYFSGPRLLFMITFHYLGIFLRIPLYLIEGVLRFDKITILKSYHYFRILLILPSKNLKSENSV